MANEIFIFFKSNVKHIDLPFLSTGFEYAGQLQLELKRKQDIQNIVNMQKHVHGRWISL